MKWTSQLQDVLQLTWWGTYILYEKLSIEYFKYWMRKRSAEKDRVIRAGMGGPGILAPWVLEGKWVWVSCRAQECCSRRTAIHEGWRQGRWYDCCCSLLLAAALGPEVQWMSLTLPPRLDSAGKVMEQVSIWELLQRSGEGALSSSTAGRLSWWLSWRTRGLHLFLCLSVIIYLWLLLLASVNYFCAGAPRQWL